MKPRDVSRALKRKGFDEREGANHRKFYFMVDGKRTGLFTIMSRSPGDIAPQIQSAMAGQMKISVDEFRRFIECTLTEDDYRALLENGGHLAGPDA